MLRLSAEHETLTPPPPRGLGAGGGHMPGTLSLVFAYFALLSVVLLMRSALSLSLLLITYIDLFQIANWVL